MELILYNTRDTKEVLNKRLTDRKKYNITFKDSADVISPVIYLSTKDSIPFNYAHIPDFKRYYFIVRVTYENKNLVKLELDCDVLESYKDDILKGYGLITRKENGEPFYNGGDYLAKVTKEHMIYKSDTTLERSDNIVLTTFKGEDKEV